MYSRTPNSSRRYQSSNRSRSVGLDHNRVGITPNRGQNDFYELRSRVLLFYNTMIIVWRCHFQCCTFKTISSIKNVILQ